MPIPPSGIDDLDGTNGFRILREDEQDVIQATLAGDIDGDGFLDLIVGAPGNDQGGTDAGAVYVIFGKADGFGAVVDLGDVARGQGGFKLLGEAAGDRAGASVASAGDIDGDGLSDLILGNGAFRNGGDGAYVLFGRAGGFDTAATLGDVADGKHGFRLVGAEDAGLESRYPLFVASSGDVDGDGFDDMVVGAPRWNDDWLGAPHGKGAAYVVSGKADGFGATVDLGDVAAGRGGARLAGEADDDAGRAVASAGDVNGDGFDDVFVGAPSNEFGFYTGAAYVVFGQADGLATGNLADLADGERGFKVLGEPYGGRAGGAVASAGDINGDGFDDLIIGARNLGDGLWTYYGAAYVVFGKEGGFGTVNLSDVADGNGGFRLKGTQQYSFAGRTVASAGDINGDGFDDIAVSGNYDPPDRPGGEVTYVIFGRADGFASMDLEEAIAGGNGFRFVGADLRPSRVSSAGDVNGDGFDDLVLSDSVIFGGDFSGAVTAAGTDAADSLTGTAGADVMVGGRGDDLLRGLGGADVLRGGAGDDILSIGDADFHHIVGGIGTDTLALDGNITLDDAAFRRIAEIEALRLGEGDIDITLGRIAARAFDGGTMRIEGSGAGNAAIDAGGLFRDLAVDLSGRAGASTIRGGAGDDRLNGGKGDDIVEGGAGNDTLDGGEGNDTADYSDTTLGVSVRLAAGTAIGDASEVGTDTLVSIETVLGGRGADRIIGDAAANRLEGNAGEDFLEGGKGNDTLLGGAGDDTLRGARDHDRLEGGAGLDHLHGDSGNDTLSGGDNNDRLVGGAGNDRLEGGGGADELRGESGRDVLIGGGAGDKLYGGYGADTLTGGAGADRFFLTALGESGTSAATRDVITDFEAGVDVINLAKINAVQGSGGNAAFSFIGEDAFTAAGQLRFFKDVPGNRTLVEGNVNADLASDFQIALTGLHDLAAGDFVL